MPSPGPSYARRPSSRRREESIYAAAEGVFPSAVLSPRGPPVLAANHGGPASPTSPSGGGIPFFPASGSGSRQQNSTQVASLLAPVQSQREAIIRAGQKPPDHAKTNVSAIKEMSSLNKLRKQAEAHAAAEATHARTRPTPPSSASRVRPSPPAAVNSDTRDFVRENRVVAPLKQAISQPKRSEPGVRHPDFGRVPDYLLERKIEQLEKMEAELRLRELGSVPPGMRLLSEEERLETLAVLRRNRDDLEVALQALPLRIETPGQIRRCDEIQERIREVEEGMKAFTRARVLVKL